VSQLQGIGRKIGVDLDVFGIPPIAQTRGYLVPGVCPRQFLGRALTPPVRVFDMDKKLADYQGPSEDLCCTVNLQKLKMG